jgi:hypothetical protein
MTQRHVHLSPAALDSSPRQSFVFYRSFGDILETGAGHEFFLT